MYKGDDSKALTRPAEVGNEVFKFHIIKEGEG
jgi:hypothetical protein